MNAAHPEELRRRAAWRGTLAAAALSAGGVTVAALIMNRVGGLSAGPFPPGCVGSVIGVTAGSWWRNRSPKDLRSASLALALPLRQQRDVWRAVRRRTPAADPFRRYIEWDLAIRLARSRKVETVMMLLFFGGLLWLLVALRTPAYILALCVVLLIVMVAQLRWSLRLRTHALGYIAIVR